MPPGDSIVRFATTQIIEPVIIRAPVRAVIVNTQSRLPRSRGPRHPREAVNGKVSELTSEPALGTAVSRHCGVKLCFGSLYAENGTKSTQMQSETINPGRWYGDTFASRRSVLAAFYSDKDARDRRGICRYTAAVPAGDVWCRGRAGTTGAGATNARASSHRDEKMTHPDPDALHKLLAGMTYPCDRVQLVQQASSRGADDDLLGHLGTLPDIRFADADAVYRAFETRQ